MVGNKNALGCKRSRGERQAIRERMMGNNLGLANRGKKRTEEMKEAMALRAMGNKNMLGKNHSEESKIKMSKCLDTHHRDFDHSNDLSGNRVELPHKFHCSLHRQAGRRAIIFVKHLVEKGILEEGFYDKFLTYINQEETNLIDKLPRGRSRRPTSK